MKIAYVGPFAFPSSSANALRVKGMAEALAMAGHEVQIYSSIKAEAVGGGTALPESIQFDCVPEFENGLFSRLPRGIRGLFLGDITQQRLQSLNHKPDVVVLYGTELGYLLRMLDLCKKYNIPLVLDVVEWYDPRHFPGGLLGPFAIANELSMRFVARKATGMFTISRYLEKYFLRQGCRTLRVPPLFSLPKTRPQKFRESNQILNLCYAGSPGKKEDMTSIFTGLQIAHDEGIKFKMHIVGITADEFLLNFGMKSLPILSSECLLKFHGKVENSEACQIVASCDFTVILRQNWRVIKAGFPSKVAESMCLGTPIIANLISNLDEYLIDGFNSIIVQELRPNDFFGAVRRASLLNRSEYFEMQRQALDCFDRNFSIKSHFEEIGKFINGIV